MKAALLIMAILVTGISPAGAQKSKEKDKQFKEMTALIESGFYLFSVQSVQPSGARTIHTSSSYILEARDTIFRAYLPYFGRAYSPSYGGDGGIDFEAPPENLQISLNEKKRMVNVEFEIKGESDKYELFLSVGSSGYASLGINSQNRQPISYSGLVGPLREK